MLKPRQEQFITSLIDSGSVKAACEKLNMSRSTYYQWLKNEVFVKELREKQNLIYHESVIYTKCLFRNAIDSYENLLSSDNENVKLKAASYIIENTATLLYNKKCRDEYEKKLLNS